MRLVLFSAASILVATPAVAGPNLEGWCFPVRPFESDSVAVPDVPVSILRPEIIEDATDRLTDKPAVQISPAEYKRYTGHASRRRYQYLIRGSVAAPDDAQPAEIVANWPRSLRFEANRSERSNALQLIIWQSYDGPGTDHNMPLALDSSFPVSSYQLDCRVFF
jgi:hypothetical protein